MRGSAASNALPTGDEHKFNMSIPAFQEVVFHPIVVLVLRRNLTLYSMFPRQAIDKGLPF